MPESINKYREEKNNMNKSSVMKFNRLARIAMDRDI